MTLESRAGTSRPDDSRKQSWHQHGCLLSLKAFRWVSLLKSKTNTWVVLACFFCVAWFHLGKQNAALEEEEELWRQGCDVTEDEEEKGLMHRDLHPLELVSSKQLVCRKVYLFITLQGKVHHPRWLCMRAAPDVTCMGFVHTESDHTHSGMYEPGQTFHKGFLIQLNYLYHSLGDVLLLCVHHKYQSKLSRALYLLTSFPFNNFFSCCLMISAIYV